MPKNTKKHGRSVAAEALGAFRDRVRIDRQEARDRRNDEKVVAERARDADDRWTLHPGLVALALAGAAAGMILTLVEHDRRVRQVTESWTYPAVSPDDRFLVAAPEMPGYWPTWIAAGVLVITLVLAVLNALRRHPQSRLAHIKHEFVMPLAALIVGICSVVSYPAYAHSVLDQTAHVRTEAFTQWAKARYGYDFSPIPVDQLDVLTGHGRTTGSTANRIIVNNVVISSFREGDRLIVTDSQMTQELPHGDQKPSDGGS